MRAVPHRAVRSARPRGLRPECRRVHLTGLSTQTIAIYIRRSRKTRGTKGRPSGVSREQQEVACRAQATANGDVVAHVLVDWDVSGRKGEDERLAFAQLIPDPPKPARDSRSGTAERAPPERE